MDPYALERDALVAVLGADGADPQPAYRADQVRRWLARGVDDPAAMTDLPRALRERLAAAVDPPPTLVRETTADDGLTRKLLLSYADGEAVEAVLMLYPAVGERAARATVCISTQAGCAMGCPFCATGQAGLRRQLTLGEIVRQVTAAQQRMATADGLPAGVPDHVTNVVFMGMGEPLANLGPTIAAVRWLHGTFGLSARSITLSTVGLVPGIRRLAALGLPITLAVSLHAPDDALRDDLVPVNRQHPLDELLAACGAYVEATGRRLTFEYVLIDGINSAPEQAERLAALVSGRGPAPRLPGPVPHVNLIPMNPTPAVPWRAPAPEAQRAFADTLAAAGVPVTLRRTRGSVIDAACGQLYADYAMSSGRTLPAAQGAAQRLQPLLGLRPGLRDAAGGQRATPGARPGLAVAPGSGSAPGSAR